MGEIEVWTPEDEAIYHPLRCKRMRIDKRKRVDNQPGGRKRQFSPRKRSSLSELKTTGEK